MKQNSLTKKPLLLSPEELKKIADFFQILIGIDQKNKRKDGVTNEQQ